MPAWRRHPRDQVAGSGRRLRPLAGDDVLLRVVGPALEGVLERPQSDRDPGRWPPRAAAMPSSVSFAQTCGSVSVMRSAGSSPLRICSASVTPAPPTAAEFVTAAPTRPSTSSSCCDEAGVVGADDRHELGIGLDQRIDDHVVDARGPDAVEVVTGRQEVVELLDAGRLVPVGVALEDDVDVRVSPPARAGSPRRGRRPPAAPAMPRM